MSNFVRTLPILVHHYSFFRRPAKFLGKRVLLIYPEANDCFGRKNQDAAVYKHVPDMQHPHDGTIPGASSDPKRIRAGRGRAVYFPRQTDGLSVFGLLVRAIRT
jgi:hypothetical protein